MSSEEQLSPSERIIKLKPSELIRLALKDLDICVGNGYDVDMRQWHVKTNKVCSVCLAGAVMANTLNLDHGTPRSSDLPPQVVRRLHALNDFRMGDIIFGLANMGHTVPKDWPSTIKITHYREDPIKFISDMNKLANNFEKVGL